MDPCKLLKEVAKDSSDKMRNLVVRIEEAKSGNSNAKRREDINRRVQDEVSVEAEIKNMEEEYLASRSKLIRSTLLNTQSFNQKWLEVRNYGLKFECGGFLEVDRDLDMDKKRLEAMHKDLVQSTSSRNPNEPTSKDFDSLSELASKVSAATGQNKQLEQDYRQTESKMRQVRDEHNRIREALKRSGARLTTARRLARAGHCHLRSVNSAMTKEIATETESTKLEDKLTQMQDEASLNSAILCNLQNSKKTLMEERADLIAEIASISKRIDDSLNKECRDAAVCASARGIAAESVAAGIVEDVLSKVFDKLF
jgi:hypothetical protein